MCHACDREKKTICMRKIQTPALSSMKKKNSIGGKGRKRHQPLIREGTRCFVYKIN